MASGETTALPLEDERLPELQPDVARFIIAPEPGGAEAAAGSGLGQSATVVLPTTDLDSDDSWGVSIGFYLASRASRLQVVFSGDGVIPASVLAYLMSEIAGDFRESVESTDIETVAFRSRWPVVQLLRGRIRAVEDSVRKALEDDHFSPADYEALRLYPVRLKAIERLASSLPDPTWTDHTHGPYDIPRITVHPDYVIEALRGVPNEAREAVARLSGLISSQQIVLTQRQAAETARFQRLVTLVGTGVLVPGLIAAIFGANVGFHGRDKVGAFWAMLLFMAGGGAASYALLRSLERKVWSRLARRLKLTRLTKASEDARLMWLVAFALLAVAAGLYVLSRA